MNVHVEASGTNVITGPLSPIILMWPEYEGQMTTPSGQHWYSRNNATILLYS